MSGSGTEFAPLVDIKGLLETVAKSAAEKTAERLQAGESTAVRPRLLTVEQAAVYLGRSKRSVEHLIADGKLPTVRHDRRVFLDRHDLDRWIDSNKS